jgi:hypothetical protein
MMRVSEQPQFVPQAKLGSWKSIFTD